MPPENTQDGEDVGVPDLDSEDSESFAAFLNGVILQKKQRGSYHCSCHHNTSRE